VTARPATAPAPFLEPAPGDAAGEVLSPADLRREPARWDGVVAPAGPSSLFASAGWLEAWHRWLGPETEPRFELVRVDGEPVGLLPLVLRRSGLGLRRLAMPVARVAPRSRIVADREGAVAAALGRALDRVDVPLLATGRLPAADGTIAAFERAGLRVRVRRVYALPQIDASGAWDAYLAGLSKNLRRSIKQAPRKLAPFELERVAAEADLHRVLAAIEQVSRRTWKHDAGTSLAASPAAFGFFRAVLEAAHRDGRMLTILAWDRRTRPAEPVGFLFAVRFGDTLHALKTGYVDAFAEHAIGTNLLATTFAAAFADPAVRTVDLDAVAGGADYKLRWATRVAELVEAWVAPPNWRGGMLDRGLGAARGVHRRLGKLKDGSRWKH